MKYGIKNEKRLENVIVEEFDIIDMCQPDMALTPQEIIERFTLGLPAPNLERQGHYDADKYDYDDKLPEDFDDISDVYDEVNSFELRLAELSKKRDELKRREIEELQELKSKLADLKSAQSADSQQVINDNNE